MAKGSPIGLLLVLTDTVDISYTEIAPFNLELNKIIGVNMRLNKIVALNLELNKVVTMNDYEELESTE